MKGKIINMHDNFYSASIFDGKYKKGINECLFRWLLYNLVHVQQDLVKGGDAVQCVKREGRRGSFTSHLT